MPGFSAKAWRDAHAPWTYTTSRGRTVAARPVSAPQLIEYFGAIDGAPIAAQQSATRELLRLAFPFRVSFLWRGDPVEEILEAPPGERKATLRSFFASLGMMRKSPRSPRIPSPPSSSS